MNYYTTSRELAFEGDSAVPVLGFRIVARGNRRYERRSTSEPSRASIAIGSDT
jgi:hypothetical protein